MGGVRTDHTAGSPTLKGLYAAGEAACWDLHGFNRLGGNSVAETVVGGMIVGEFIADFCDGPESNLQFSTGLIREFLEHEQAKIDALISGKGSEEANVLRVRMQEIMTSKVGIFRTARTSPPAVEELQSLLQAEPEHRIALQRRGAPIPSSCPRTECRRCCRWHSVLPTVH
jgi:fumarate reductase flavoprotein subunit